MIMFFDTETTGLVNDSLPLAAQPYMVQLAAILAEEDGTERASFSFIVDPGVSIPAQATHIHGINDDIATRCGVSTKFAVALFARFYMRADTLVAHNIKFDDVIIRAANLRSDSPADFGTSLISPLGSACTMELSSPFLALPPTPAMIRSGRTGFKPPRLSEAYEFFFGEKLEGAHDALVDVRACARIYFEMKRRGA